MSATADPLRWISGRQGAIEIGHDGSGFGFDCEGPRHTVWLAPHALADRLITNGEWRAFVEDGGYSTANLWLSDGWAWVRENAIVAPLYWRRDEDGEWTRHFELDGLMPIDPAGPVRHVSYYEADAFARWAGARLPTEAEWESAAEGLDTESGNSWMKRARSIPLQLPPATDAVSCSAICGNGPDPPFYLYPGFRPAQGAIAEYNGKFMSNQFVLKGGSCATPRGHVWPSYRDFFYPHQRWQFTGVRLAKDA